MKSQEIAFILSLLLTTARPVLAGEEKKPTSEQALATIGYLNQNKTKKTQFAILKEDLRLFIKKVTLLAKQKDTVTCQDLFKLDERLKTEFEEIEIRLLLNALNNAAYLIKKRTSKLCSIEEIQVLNDELHRWCAWTTALINEKS